MHADKFSHARDDNGLVPAGQYFQRVAAALRTSQAHEAAPLQRSEESERRIRDRIRQTVQ